MVLKVRKRHGSVLPWLPPSLNKVWFKSQLAARNPLPYLIDVQTNKQVLTHNVVLKTAALTKGQLGDPQLI